MKNPEGYDSGRFLKRAVRGKRFSIHLPTRIFIRKGDSDKAMEVQSNENAALLKLLKTKSRTKTELLKVSSARRRARQAALLDAYLRSVPDALAHSGSKLRRAVKDNALASVALQRLLETGQVIEFKYKKQRLCLHLAHLPQQPALLRHSQETSLDLDHDLSLQEVQQVYDRVRRRQLGAAVFISDLATELRIGFEKLHEWIRSEVIGQ